MNFDLIDAVYVDLGSGLFVVYFDLFAFMVVCFTFAVYLLIVSGVWAIGLLLGC